MGGKLMATCAAALCVASSFGGTWAERLNALFAIDGKDNVIAPEDCGLVNGHVTFNGWLEDVAEVRGFKDGKAVNRDKWRANNLFGEWDYTLDKAKVAWKASFTLDEIPENGYLSVACNGNHGRDGVWAAFKIDGEYVGCPDRAPSFASNTPFRASSSSPASSDLPVSIVS